MALCFRICLCFTVLERISALNSITIQDGETTARPVDEVGTMYSTAESTTSMQDAFVEWAEISGGGCYFHGRECIESDGQWSGQGYRGHGPYGSCEVSILIDTYFKFEEFATEVNYGILTTDHEQQFSGIDVPPTAKYRHVRWDSGGKSSTKRGWKMCKSDAPWAITMNPATHADWDGCVMDGECITSTNFWVSWHPGVRFVQDQFGYGNWQRCEVEIYENLYLKVEKFETEACCDTLVMDDMPYSGAISPPSKFYSRDIKWSTDGAGTQRGWKICKTRAPWTITGEGCVMDGDCISSLSTHQTYHYKKHCSVDIFEDTYLKFEIFDIAIDMDILQVDGEPFTGQFAPPIGKYKRLEWKPREWAYHGAAGWKVCKSDPPWTISEDSAKHCVIEDPCIMNKVHEPIQQYGNSEQCIIDIHEDLYLEFEKFDTEAWFDFLVLDGKWLSGSDIPASGTVSKRISWSTDSSVTKKGWKACRKQEPSLKIIKGDICEMKGDCVITIYGGPSYDTSYKQCSVQTSGGIAVKIEADGHEDGLWIDGLLYSDTEPYDRANLRNLSEVPAWGVFHNIAWSSLGPPTSGWKVCRNDEFFQ